MNAHSKIILDKENMSSCMSRSARIVGVILIAASLTRLGPLTYWAAVAGAGVLVFDYLQYAIGYKQAIEALKDGDRYHQGKNHVWYPLRVWCFRLKQLFAVAGAAALIVGLA